MSTRQQSTQAVLQLADFGGPYSGNFIASLRALENALASKGVRQVYAFSDIAEKRPWLHDLRNSGAKVYLLPKREGILSRVERIREIVRAENAQVIHTHFTTFDVAAALAAGSLRLSGHKVRTLWHVHSARLHGMPIRRQLKDALKFRLLGQSARALAVSGSLGEELKQRGMRAKRVSVILNGVDVHRVTADSDPRVPVRTEFGIDESTTVLLMFGWHGWIKGLDIAAAAVSHCERDDIRLLIIGDLHTHAYLRSWFGTIPERVIVAPPRECVSDYYRAANAFVSASRSEGMSYGAGEAMAAGLAVLVSDIPGHRWATSEGVLRFASEDVAELSTAIERFASLPAEARTQMGEANREFAISKLSLSRWAEHVIAEYRLQADFAPAVVELTQADVEIP